MSFLFTQWNFIKRVFGIIFDSEVLHIIRPLLYVCLVMKHGRKSWTPIWISLALDILIILLVFLRLSSSEKLRHIERRDLTKRNIMSLMKYLIRDPIFENYTLVALKKVCQVMRVPSAIFGIILSILNYYRYYTYIAWLQKHPYIHLSQLSNKTSLIIN